MEMTTNSRLLSALLSERGLLAMLVASQILAFIYALIAITPFWQTLGLVSLFIHCTAFSALFPLLLVTKLDTQISDRLSLLLLVISFLITTAITSFVFPAILQNIGIIEAVNFSALVFENLAICLCIVTLFAHFLAIYADNIEQIQRLSQAELDALHARIRPHFLYNALNTVAELAHVDACAAEQSAITLANLSKAALDSSKWVTVDEEIALCKDYIGLEKWRFGTRLQVEWDIRGVTGKEQIPSLILQPLIENAVTHGVEPSTTGAKIRIAIIKHQPFLNIAISNEVNAGGAVVYRGHGMGLSNIKKRLQLHFGGNIDFDVSSEAQSFTVKFSIPI
ncbi:sensor histidine kinase [Pseudoalteromonas sp. T1lg65]|uniref:sensor histidine kinase n=1 Tax=Pseudoalteromonas sp. T1lg65 TaxID=2077101 RepID=UPI003F79D48F